MKYSLFIMIFFLACITRGYAKTNNAPEALLALSKKLASLKSISLHYSWENNDPEDDHYSLFEGTSYLEFNETDKQTVSRFRMEGDKWIQVYNGTDMFYLNKNEKTYELHVQPKQRSLGYNSFFVNSIQTLRSVIQEWVQNERIQKFERDTAINNRSYKLVQVNIKGYMMLYLNNIEGLDRLPDSKTLHYNIIIDKGTGLPYQIVYTNNFNKGGHKTVFTNINTKPKAPDTKSWDLITYQNVYTPKKEDNTPLIAAGAIMPEWELTEYNEKDDPAFKSSEMKGKLVMLDFWIKNCGYCMSSFPELQRLQKTYGGDKFQLIGINASEKKEQVGFFYKREKPLYKFLYNGQPLAKAWGIENRGYPTVVLVDKTGKVIYAGSFDYKKVEG